MSTAHLSPQAVGPKAGTNAPPSSWWVNAPRDQFQHYVEQTHLPRMLGSAFSGSTAPADVSERAVEMDS